MTGIVWPKLNGPVELAIPVNSETVQQKTNFKI